MAQTLCIKCGSELKASSYCQLCQQPLIFACTSCEYVTEEKVHPDCRNAEVLAKEEEKAQDTTTTTASKFPNGENQKETFVNKRKEWKEVAEMPSNIAKNDDNADTISPFIAATDDMRSVVIYIV